MAYEYPNFQGQQFILEKGDHSRWSAWNNSGGHHSDQLLSFRSVLCGWVAYQYPGYQGYQYVLEQTQHGREFHTYSEFSTQVHTGQLQSIQRVQQ